MSFLLLLHVLHDTSLDGLRETRVLTSKINVRRWCAGGGTLLIGRGGDGIAHGHGLVGSRQEDDLAVGRLGHGLHGLEVADLHGRSGAENIGSLSHELGRLDL